MKRNQKSQNSAQAPVWQWMIVAAIALLLLWPLYHFFRWAVWDASFLGSSREQCQPGGACWIFVGQRLEQFLFGFYPEAERWRLYLVLALWLGVSGLLTWKRLPYRLPGLALAVIAMPLLSWFLLKGNVVGLPLVETSQWGGLMLTLFLSSLGICLSLPLGIALALARRSSLVIIKGFAVAFIEVWRGVPLITVLFMASVMFPLFLPPGVEVDKLLRCLVGVVCFTSAYLAEVVRAGLQSIPKGQSEAAKALGLSTAQRYGLILLPQALQKVIPGLVNTFIGLFKDTSLVLIIGMFDLLGMVQAAATDPDWLGFAVEGYLFAGFVFWLFCFSMSQASLRLEKKLANTSR